MKKEDQIKYQNSYNKEKYDTLTVVLKKGEKERIKKIAKEAGESMSEFVAKAIEERITGGKQMKNYKEYEKQEIGVSDIAELIVNGGNGKPEAIQFGADAAYSAYIVDAECEIPKYYREVSEFTDWMKIYDDCGLTYQAKGDRITVYRAGDMGCIIRIEKEENEK